jgi:hypothetical protein
VLVGLLIVGLAGGVALGTMLGGDSSGTATSTGPTTPEAAPGGSVTGSTAGPSPLTQATPAPDSLGNCASDFPAGEPFVGGPSVEMVDLGESNGAVVDGAIYPRPDYQGDPWSQWGQGLALADGRFYSAVGAPLTPDGNSYLYAYDPATGTLAMLGDLLSYVEHQPGSWGYGKIHAQMVAGACGEIYFSSYWGSYSGIHFDDVYRGDILFRLDPAARTLDPLTVPVDQHGQASLAGWAQGGLLYGEAVDPVVKDQTDIEEGPLFVYDVTTEQVVFQGPDSPHVGYRNMIVDGSGRAYYSIGGGELAVYDPATNALGTHPHAMPADWLRASTTPTPDGRVAAVTDEPYTFFMLQPSGEIQTLGPARGYTASMAMHPDGNRFFYVPDAHGGSWMAGTPLISVDTSTGEETVVAELNAMAEENLGVTLGGSYDVVADPSGDKVYVGMNAGQAGSGEDFGEVALLVVHLP